MAKISVLALLVCMAFVAIQNSDATENPKTVCYYESWVHWRQGEGKMDPEDIDTTLCTHIVYSYFGIDALTHNIKLLDEYLMKDLHDMEKFTRHKGQAKAMIAVGGASMSDQFSITAATESYRTKFVESTFNLISQYGFDGVMIDWTGMAATDSENLLKLLDQFDEKFASTSYIMGFTLPATIASYDNYNIPAISNYVDFFNVLTLDYTGSWSKTVGHASAFLDQMKTLEDYHKRGAPRHKMVSAMPLFARTWTLSRVEKQDVGDLASGPGSQGPYTQSPGLLSYNELCHMIQSNTNAFTIVRDSIHVAVYAVHIVGDHHAEWISFEDSKTLGAKAKNLTELGFGGISVYTLSNEDTHGVCGTKNPLLHAINSNYFKGPVTEPPMTTLAPVTHTTHKITDIPGVFHCHQEGLFRDKLYCEKYYECQNGDFGLEMTVHYCDSHNLAFDEVTKKCIDHTKVPGC